MAKTQLMTDRERAVIEEFASTQSNKELREQALTVFRQHWPHDKDSLHQRFMREVDHPCPDPVLRGALRFQLKDLWSKRNG